MSMCPMCSMGLYSSCLNESCEQMEATLKVETSQAETPSPTPQRTLNTNEPDLDTSEDRHSRDSSRGRGSRNRSKRGLSDSQSSGRKIAAKLYPLDSESPCEWKGLGNCGGGDFPILGCFIESPSKQEARHHGPEKNVQNNEQGNVHRICHYCHYRWHAKNDKTYDWNAGVWPPHSPRPLTEAENKAQAVDYMRYLTTGRRAKKMKETD